MFCSECSAEVGDGWSWCVACGADLEALRAMSARASSQPGSALATPAPGRGPTERLAGQGPSDEDVARLEPGHRIGPGGRYEVHEIVGRGGMGIIYRATDHHLSEIVAIKILLPSLLGSPRAHERFRAEARTARSLSHQNIVRVFGAEEHEGCAFIVMQYLQGHDLRQELARHRRESTAMPLERIAAIIEQGCLALEHAHRTTLHRDIKPENMLLVESTGGGDDGVRMKLLDFGISCAIDESLRLSSQLAAGTAGYIAPELLERKEATHLSDIYSLGVVLYECLTGRLPVGFFNRPSSHRKGLGPAWDDLVRSMLASEPADRPASAQVVRDRLAAAMSSRGASRAQPEEPPASAAMGAPRYAPLASRTSTAPGSVKASPRASSSAGRGRSSRAPWILGGLLALAGLVLGGLWWQRSRPEAETAVGDAVGPVLVRLRPGDGERVFSPAIELRGEVEQDDLSSVHAPGATCSVVGRTFRCATPMATGRRSIELVLIDIAGNQSRIPLTFEVIEPPPPDRSAPRVVALQPQSGAAAPRGMLDVSGEVAEDDLLSVTGCGNACTVDGRRFSCRCEIQPGPMRLDFEASDGAGNRTAWSLEVMGHEPAPEGLRLTGFTEGGFEVHVRDIDLAEVVRVPAVDDFRMGTALAELEAERRLFGDRMPAGSARFEDEVPARDILLDTFFMDRNEVTWRQFRSFSGATGARMPDPPSWPAGPEHPAVGVTWDEASAFCEWVGGRLPTEAEWEHAARGRERRRFPWGDSWPAQAVANIADATAGKKRTSPAIVESYDDGFAETAPVGRFPLGASPFGINDLAGNAWEWVHDWYDAHGQVYIPRNPKGPPEGIGRVQRGGSFLSGPGDCRGASRAHRPPRDRGDNVGFRCAMDEPPTATRR